MFISFKADKYGKGVIREIAIGLLLVSNDPVGFLALDSIHSYLIPVDKSRSLTL